MLQLNSKNIPYQSVQVFLSLVSKSSDIANQASGEVDISFMCNIVVKNIMSTSYIEQRVEIDTVAAGSHMETKRGIDYTQIVALWMILCTHHLLTLT